MFPVWARGNRKWRRLYFLKWLINHTVVFEFGCRRKWEKSEISESFFLCPRRPSALPRPP